MQAMLTGSVGRNGANRPSDVSLVQQCLNAIPVTHGRSGPLLMVDGKCGSKTIAAIQGFQLCHFGWKLADGRIDPAGPTWDALSALIAQLAPILLQNAPTTKQPLRVWLRNMVGSVHASAFDSNVRATVRSELAGWFSQMMPLTKSFSTAIVDWTAAASGVGPSDLLVYFVNEPRYGVLKRPDDPDAGGFTSFIGSGLVMQVYCVDGRQNALRPATYLARLAFHEMMHGKIDVGPRGLGRHPRTKAPVTDIHSQGGAGLAELPTPPYAVFTQANRDIMAHNLHLPVPMHIV